MVNKLDVKSIASQYGQNDGDTGKTEVQVAIFTSRIRELSLHLEKAPKDNHSRYGLMKMVGKRRSLLRYLRVVSEKRYLELIQKLGLRK